MGNPGHSRCDARAREHFDDDTFRLPSRVIGDIDAEQPKDGQTERKDRVIAVAANSAARRSIREMSDLSQDLIAQVELFFKSCNVHPANRGMMIGSS